MNHRCVMNKPDEYTTVRIPNDLAIEIDKLIGTKGFKTRAEVTKEALRRFLLDYPRHPTLEHFNLDEDGVRILDRELGLIIDVAFKPKGIWCDYCQTNDCRHTKFALSVPAIQKVIRKRIKDGWNLPDV